MKLHTIPTQHYQTVTGYEPGWVEINTIRFSHSLIVLPEQQPIPWGVEGFDSLQASHFAAISAAKPDVLILGTGERQHFPSPSLLSALIDKNIGVECMSNPAACRTYNILMTEGRKVALAMIFPDGASGK